MFIVGLITTKSAEDMITGNVMMIWLCVGVGEDMITGIVMMIWLFMCVGEGMITGIVMMIWLFMGLCNAHKDHQI
jgi:hypothetical protein